MKTSRITGSKYRHDNSSKKTLAYIGENLKMQKKVAYWNSDEGIYKRRMMLEKTVREEQQKRMAKLVGLEKTDKKNTLQEFKENIMDIFSLILGLLATPLVMLYDDIKKEFLGSR